MRTLDPRNIEDTEDNRKLLFHRASLTDELRSRSGKGKKASGQVGGLTTTQKEGLETASVRQTLLTVSGCDDVVQLVFETLECTASTSISSVAAKISSHILALEVLELVLQITLISLKNDTAKTGWASIFSASTLTQLASVIYHTWDNGPAPLLQRCRGCTSVILALSDALHVNDVKESLKRQIMADPWLSKRSLNVFELLMPYYTVEGMKMFSVGSCDRDIAAGVLRRLTNAMASSDEIAVVCGRAAISWVEEVWAEGNEDESFWIKTTSDACRQGEKGRNNVCSYFLRTVFERRIKSFRQLMIAEGFLRNGMEAENPWEEADLEAAVAIMKVGNSMGLIEVDRPEGEVVASKSNSAKKPLPLDTVVSLPSELISACLYHSSSVLRCSALSLLVLSASLSTPFSQKAFTLLKTFYVYGLGDEDGESRQQSIALSGKLLLRLRTSAWKARRTGNEKYVQKVQDFTQWWFAELLFNLNPAKPFRIRINALRFLDLLFQAHLQEKASSPGILNSYSSYRRVAPTPAPQFQAKHKRLDKLTGKKDASETDTVDEEEGGWPFRMDMMTPEVTFSLLRLLLSTYTALRTLSISLLETFPSPLPGYEGEEGEQKVKSQLLGPALRMVRSGREAESSAGASIIGLVWRKWVLEGAVNLNLVDIADWQLDGRSVYNGSNSLEFLNSMMSLLEFQIGVFKSDLNRAALVSPMHGTILAVRHLFLSLPISEFGTIASIEEHRSSFHRALALIEGVWQVCSPVIAAAAPEGYPRTADNEEARALMFEGEADDPEVSSLPGIADGSGGPTHKVVLSATWRSMKEAGDLLETILRLPSELGSTEFRKIWSFKEVSYVGTLFIEWLARIRHRGAFMALHPCYTRACEALLVCKDWPEVQSLPQKWLDMHLKSIISKKVSITRRSAGIPYCILGLMTVLLPIDRTSFNGAFTTLYDIAESKDPAILDESRVHAMNTLQTCFLDAKVTSAAALYIERGFLLAVSMFWSKNWICRNSSMMLFASLVSRAFGNKRTNLNRDYNSLSQRPAIADFFGRYPTLHKTLLLELQFSTVKHFDTAMSTQSNSSLFSVLMLLSLLQTPNHLPENGPSLAAPFIPMVEKCATSQMWKIREAAGDALTGLVSPSEYIGVCLNLLKLPSNATENVIHGRLGSVLRLLQANATPNFEEGTQIRHAVHLLTPSILNLDHSFAVKTEFLDIALQLYKYDNTIWANPILGQVVVDLAATKYWSCGTMHMPSAENYVTSCFKLALVHTPMSEQLLEEGIGSRFLSVQQYTLSYLSAMYEEGKNPQLQSKTEFILIKSMTDLVLCSTAAPECRTMAAQLLYQLNWQEIKDGRTHIMEALMALQSSTPIVPLQEATVILIARLCSCWRTPANEVLRLSSHLTTVDQSVDSREAAAKALQQIQHQCATDPIFLQLTLRTLQDDDPMVRRIAGEMVAHTWGKGVLCTDRKAYETVLKTAHLAKITTDRLVDWPADLSGDMEMLKNPSSLLFAIEKPNIFADDLLDTELREQLLQDVAPDVLQETRRQLTEAVAGALKLIDGNIDIPIVDQGPLGLLGNAVLCKWGYRLSERLADFPTPQVSQINTAEILDIDPYLSRTYIRRA